MAMIRVRNKLTGQVGLLPEENLNLTPGKYEQLGPNQSQNAQPQESGFLGNLVKGLTQPFVNTGQRIAGAAEVGLRQYLINESEKARLAGDNDRAIKLGQLASQETTLTNDRGYSKKLTDPLQIAKDSAAMLSWGVPVGGATKVLGKTLQTGVVGGGALTGAMSGFGYSPETSLEGLATSTAVGAGTGAVTASLLNKLLGGKTAKVTEGKQNIISKTAAKNLLKLSPADYEKITDMGVDPYKLVSKYKIVGNNYDDLLNAVQSQLGDSEGIIQNTLSKGAGETISLEPAVNALKGLRSSLSILPTNASKVAQLDDIISQLEANPNIQASEALLVKRAADSAFGKAVIQEEKGAVNTQVNKIIANNLRTTLKARFPTIEKALDSEHELLFLQDMLKGAQAKSEVVGTGALSKLDVTRPGTFLQPALENPAVVSRMAQVGAPGAATQATKPSALSQKLTSFVSGKAPTAAGATAANVTSQLTTPPKTTGTEDLFDIGTTSTEKSDTKNKFNQAMLADLVNTGGKNIDKIKAAYEFLSVEEGGTKETSQRLNTAKSGMRSVKDVRSMLKSDPSLLTKQLVPGKFFSRSFDAALYNMSDAVLRLRTGAQANDEEIRGYMNRLATSFGDNPADIEYKLKQLEDQFKDIVNQ